MDRVEIEMPWQVGELHLLHVIPSSKRKVLESWSHTRPDILRPVGPRQPSVTHQLVLIRRDGGEDGLDEDKGAKLLGLEVEQWGGVVFLLDDVDPRLVLVHGVEDDLQRRSRRDVFRFNRQTATDRDGTQSNNSLRIHYEMQLKLLVYTLNITGLKIGCFLYYCWVTGSKQSALGVCITHRNWVSQRKATHWVHL